MSKFSVKKPLTVFVAVVAVIVLGVVAFLKMTPDLLPNMDFPYIMIMTTYPGASPEKVEAEITKPLEQSMATLEHIQNVTSTSSENYSMVMLEFAEDTDLDVIGVDIQQNISALQGGWEETVGAPYVLKINPSMLPVMVAAVSMKGMDNVELTQLLEDGLGNKLEGIAGVARVSISGTVQQQLHVVLDQSKLNAVNEKIANAINGKMDEAEQALKKTQKELKSAKKKLDSGKKEMEQGKDALINETSAANAEMNYQLNQLMNAKAQLETTLNLFKSVKSGLTALEKQGKEYRQQLEELKALQKQAEEIAARQAEMDAKIAAIENSGKTPEEKEAEHAQLKQSPEYVQLEADKAALNAKMAAYQVTPETLPARIVLKEKALEEIDKNIQKLKEALKKEGVELDNLDTSIKEMETGLAQMETGIQTLKTSQQALDKAQMEGLLQMSQAATDMSVGQATITTALTQVEGGLTTLEDTRKQTLEQADVTKILTMDMVSQILTAQNFSMPAGTVEAEGVQYMVSVGEELTSAEALENLLLVDLGMDGVDPVYLKDVAAVMVTDNRAESYNRLNGKESVVLTFEKQSTYATAEATDNILEKFQQLEKENPGLEFVPLMNQGDYIYLIVETILSSLLLGAVFAILVLWLFLKDWRPTLITLCAIPLSVIFAIVLMYFSGVTINMISLSGLAVAVGMLVDNSVVVIENIYRLRSKGATVIQAAVSGAKQVAGAVTASTLTTVCVFLPIVFVEGITRQLFTDLALTMTYSLLASLIVALTLVPAMASGMLKKEKPQKKGLLDKLMPAYEKAVDWALRHKAVVLASALVLLVGSCAWCLSRGFIFMPEMDMPNVNVTVTMPEGATMEQATELADTVLERIDGLEGIETVGAMMSSGGLLGGDGDSHDVTIYITLSDETASGEAVAKRIETLCAEMECTVEATSAMMDMSMLTGSGVSLQLYCEDMETLQVAAKLAGQTLGKLKGVTEVTDGLEEAVPALHIRVDRNKAMKKGLTVAQVYMELATALKTKNTATSLTLDGKTTQVIVEKPESAKVTKDSLQDYVFSVKNREGEEEKISLAEIATIEDTTGLSTINRENQRRCLTVTATLAEGKNATLVTREAEKAMKKLDLGQGVTYRFDGENEATMEAIEQLALMLVLGVLLVYLVMVAQFQSLKSPFIVMFTIPLAFTGGFLALLICNMEISVISLIGFVMLTGIIVNNGIVLVDYINQLRLEGTERRQAIIEAGATRIRPILMTTITTILGLLDMAVRQNVGTSLMQPVAVVCIGGLLYATLMTLFVVPCIYDMVNKKELRTVSEEELRILEI
ncbi:MAG: efflux RND transporter permease subunit [Oscillospiraceae bacterium]|nr:efflux RND transporter permease subunit [Oscillospiraceae bacterium]